MAASGALVLRSTGWLAGSVLPLVLAAACTGGAGDWEQVDTRSPDAADPSWRPSPVSTDQEVPSPALPPERPGAPRGSRPNLSPVDAASSAPRDGGDGAATDASLDTAVALRDASDPKLRADVALSALEAGPDSSGSVVDTGDAGSDTAAPEAGADARSTDAGPLPCGSKISSWETDPLRLPAVGSLVVAGDSVSSPTTSWAYPALLRDALRARYGSVWYANVAVAGSVSTDVPEQIDTLPAALPGPVVVALTIGGNDWKNYIADALAGRPVPPVDVIFENIDATLAYILEPGRFGAGVEVHVVQANVYDPADGQGNYAAFGCGYAGLPDTVDFDSAFAFLNDNLYSVVTARRQTVLDLWGLFRFHGYNYADSWFRDCLHPNEEGNRELAARFYCLVTAETLPE